LTPLRENDAVMFNDDPARWRAAHAAVNAEATSAIIGDRDERDTPYLQALEAVWDEKFDRENPKEVELERRLAAERAALAAEAAPKHVAACAKPVAKKRSKKLKGDGDGTSEASDEDQPNKETELFRHQRED
jgi:hypothetical protein